jgi:predicted O-methyltransferase YrrM
MGDLSEAVVAAAARARQAGFELSCEPEVGALLAVLAAAVPEGGRILELGTGSGAGLAWLLSGLAGRTDVEILTVDVDEALQAMTREAGWPSFVRFLLADGAEVVRSSGRFDLIFADAPGGKLTGLGDSIAALERRGVLVVDDMDLARHDDPELRAALADVRDQIVAHPALATVELSHGSGIVLGVRR